MEQYMQLDDILNSNYSYNNAYACIVLLNAANNRLVLSSHRLIYSNNNSILVMPHRTRGSTST